MLESEFKDRFIIIAQRRRIKHLVVIAGPTSSGKSTLIGEVTGRRLPIMAAKLGIENLPAWPHVGAHSIREFSTPALEGLIFHYDFCLNDGSAGIYEQTRDLDVFKSAETISFVTLWTPPARLERQLYEAALRRSRPRKRHRNLLNIYGQSAQVVSFYRRWFEFCDRLGAKTRNHLIVEFDDALRFYSRAEWEGMVRAYETM